MTAFTEQAMTPLPARPDARRHRVHSGLHPRFPGLCAAHAGHRARRHCCVPASPIRRRMCCCTAPPGAPACCCPARPGPPRRSPHCGNSATTARSTSPGIPGMDVADRASRHLQRPAGGILRHRARSRRTGPDDSIADEAAAVLAGQPSAIARQRSTWRRSRWTGRSSTPCCGWTSSAPSCSGWKSCHSRRSARWSIWRCWRRRWCSPLLVLLVPALARRRIGAARSGLLRPVLYFPALGLGFLFIEICPDRESQPLAERPHQRLRPGADRHAGVLRPRQHGRRPPGRRARAAWRWFALVVVAWCLARRCRLQPADPGHAGLALGGARRACCWRCWRRCRSPWACRSRSACRAPAHGAVLPWAWGLNGAFSVVATPLANLLAREWGPTSSTAAAICWLACYPGAPSPWLRSCAIRSSPQAGCGGSVVRTNTTSAVEHPACQPTC